MPSALAKPRTRRPMLAKSEIIIYGAAILAAAILILYPLFSLLQYGWVHSETPGATMLNTLSEVRTYNAAWNSFKLAISTTFLATVVGVSLAVVVSRTNTPFVRVVEPIGVLPLLTMPFVGAVAWSLLASPRTGFLNVLFRKAFDLDMELGPFNIYSMPGLVWVMGLYYSPYAFILTNSALRSIDSSMEEAARLCGASPAKVLWFTTIPLVMPAILSGAFLTFSFCAGQFAIPQIIGIPARIEVLSTLIYAEAQNYPRDFARLTTIGFALLGMAGAALVLQRLWLRGRNYEAVSGKGARIQVLDLGWWKYVVLALTLAYVFVVLVLPFLALLYSSFLKYSSTTFDSNLLTIDNYIRIAEHPLTFLSITNSLVLATIAATLCLTLGLALSYIVHRTRVRGRGAVNVLAMLPIGIPGMVMAVGLLAAWISPPLVLYGTMGILVVSYVANTLPTATQASAAGLVQIGKELEESARVSGAPWLSMVRFILLPLVRRAMVGAWLLLFITKFRELETSVLLYTPGQEVVSVTLLNLWEAGSYNPVAAFSIIVTAIALAIFVLMQLLGGGSGIGIQR